MSFLLSIVDFKKKPKPSKKRSKDPFSKENREGALFVDQLSTTHSLVLNKFNLVTHHTIIITDAFEKQTSPLSIRDFVVFWRAVVELKALGFYNCGNTSSLLFTITARLTIGEQICCYNRSKFRGFTTT
jgi:ATP adenylyltransferase/5',5'''-P-1,P-4-tetraphosphate phosphorylase II